MFEWAVVGAGTPVDGGRDEDEDEDVRCCFIVVMAFSIAYDFQLFPAEPPKALPHPISNEGPTDPPSLSASQSPS